MSTPLNGHRMLMLDAAYKDGEEAALRRKPVATPRETDLLHMWYAGYEAGRELRMLRDGR